MDQATVAPSVESPLQNIYVYFAEADEDSAPADGTTHAVDDGFGISGQHLPTTILPTMTAIHSL